MRVASPRRYWRRFRNQDRELPEVLGSGGEVEFVSRSVRTAVIYSPTIAPHIDTAVYCGGVRSLRGMVPWEQMAVLGAHRAQSSHEPEPLAGMIGGNAAWQFAIPPVEGPVLTA